MGAVGFSSAMLGRATKVASGKPARFSSLLHCAICRCLPDPSAITSKLLVTRYFDLVPVRCICHPQNALLSRVGLTDVYLKRLRRVYLIQSPAVLVGFSPYPA